MEHAMSPDRTAGRPPSDEDATERALRAAVLRLNARAWGIAVGLILGVGLFVATNFLVLKGGPVVGPHLALLGVYLPGYRVTFVGSLVGFAYMFVIGYLLGRTIGAVYNTLIDQRR
jgi:hypothetical protein